MQKEEQYRLEIREFIFQNNVPRGLPLYMHIVGSSAESIQIFNPFPDQTDIDIMLECSWFQAYERRTISGKKNQMIFRMDCKGAVPGYAFLNLQIFDDVTNTTDEISFPSSDILTLISSLMNIDLPMQKFFGLIEAPRISNGYLNGPSLAMGILTQGNDLTSSFPSFITSCDRVFAIKCDEWPKIADEWMQRERRYSWPSGEIIEKAIELGCHLVPVGKDDKCEWRISFVLAEKLLVRNMNPMQHFVYSFLKSIKEEIFSSVTSGISSYVLKTVLFWVSEENDVSKWRPSTVLQHVRVCFLKLTEFLCSGRCPHYFMKSCNLFYKKITPVEITKLIAKLTKMTDSGNFKSDIINLKSVKLLCKYMFLQNMRTMRSVVTFLEIWSQSYGKYLLRLSNELTSTFVEKLFNNKDLDRPEHMMMTIANVLTKVKREDSVLHVSVSFRDTLIGVLSCMQIRAKCAYEFQTLTGPSSDKSIDEKIQFVSHLIKKSKLQVETLCPGDLTQIAHTFFSLGCYEDCLKIVSPMLEKLKTKFQPGFGSVMSLIQVHLSIMMSKKNDVTFASPLRPILHTEFFPFEVQMLTKDLKLEIVTLEMQNEILRKSLPIPIVFPAMQVKLKVNSLVYSLYLKFQCYRSLGSRTGSCSALEDFKNASSGIFDNAISFNLLGCCLKENGQLEEGIRIFGRSVYKNRELLGTKYQIAILLKHAFKS
ncbi:uncharacterized protein LOC134280673 [Saccostrea cucullata]|uniref:uncharacterized protein LOC134280673 n=1 Tax=Saccostrea cuccullata TaxID=36930 RepID=UPI002ED283B7